MHFTSHNSNSASHVIRSHHTKILHHTIFHVTPFTFHITPPLYNIPHHITTYHMFHATSRTFNVATHLTSDHYIVRLRSHYTAVCLGTTISHHHISSTCSTSQTQSISYTIPHPQLFHTTPTFNITAYFTPHHIPHHVTPPHLDFTSHHHMTSQHIALFSTYDVTIITQHIAYHHNCTPSLVTFHIAS